MSEVFQTTQEILEENPGLGYKRLKEEIIAMRQDIKQEMDKGLSSEEMAAEKSLLQAVEVADEVLDKIYQRITG